MIPLLHDFDGETVLVFGGGRVGARKARRFAREARVVVVSPTFAGEDGDERADFGDAELVREAPEPEDVPDWFDRTDPALAVAATDSEALNERIEAVARERGALVNRADRHGGREPGSVVVPATVRDDPVVAAVATGGASPALSRLLRQRIETEIADAGAMAELTGEIRAELQAEGVDPAVRRDAVRAVVRSDAVWKALDSGVPKGRQVAADVISDVTGETA
ncbi:precorrin-2 dehydrogenase/sirohydrochlorin ferrochelatase family protein [Halosimplex pelagicum]|uniref:precorrin-2 dehydrogenase n=1 Tax=Halosimplex pelagicum TaxID=869886 RepID=A0A7D5PD71_9EURY|nr:bifunctional precorrin-2 dehydrogenase/sirohydrochlorin ferrochelatase [Halosimplex pelagicum]QLH84125.1 bifunctional precorrin-2 dehydrogenase/sirohydrochlorin ferrochelatase [Halosimplex pelagicum]